MWIKLIFRKYFPILSSHGFSYNFHPIVLNCHKLHSVCLLLNHVNIQRELPCTPQVFSLLKSPWTGPLYFFVTDSSPCPESWLSPAPKSFFPGTLHFKILPSFWHYSIYHDITHIFGWGFHFVSKSNTYKHVYKYLQTCLNGHFKIIFSF